MNRRYLSTNISLFFDTFHTINYRKKGLKACHYLLSLVFLLSIYTLYLVSRPGRAFFVCTDSMVQISSNQLFHNPLKF